MPGRKKNKIIIIKIIIKGVGKGLCTCACPEVTFCS